MKKLRIFLPCVLLLIMLSLLLCACYVSKPAKMSDLIGTYELTHYTYKSASAPSDAEAENRIATREIKAYLIIRSDGTGAYVYRDKDKPLYAEGVRIDYSYDSDDPSMIKQISYENGGSGTRGLPGSGKESLGLTFKKKDKNLNWYQPAIEKIREYTTSVTYTKVSKDTDMTYVNKILKTNLAYPEFALNRLTGTYIHSATWDQESVYQYYLVELNMQTRKAVATFAYKDAPQNAQTLESDITVAYPADTSNTVLLTLLGNTYSRSLFLPLSSHLYCERTDEEGNVTSISLNYDGRAIEEIVQDYLPQEEPDEGDEPTDE